MSFIGFIIAYPFIWLFSLLPLKILYQFSKLFNFFIYYVVRYRRAIVHKNIRKSFPEKSEKEVEEIVKRFYKYFSQLLVEIIKLISISEKELTRRIKYKNPELLDELFDKGLHCIVVTAHYGNWEWLVGVSKSTKYKTMSLYKPMSNKNMEWLMTKLRTRMGAELVPMNKAIRAILKYKKDNTPALSLFIADQRPYKSYIQYWTKFLNQDSPVFLGVEKIAKSTNQAVIFFKIERAKRGYYEVEIVKLFEKVDSLPEYAITEAHVKYLESIIKQAPEYWLWTHNRWKYKRPEEV